MTGPHYVAFPSDEGATAVEYAIMVALIALVIFAGVTGIGLYLSDGFEDACTQLAEQDATTGDHDCS